MKYCVTSVILPEFDVPETCALLQELGYDGVEWRVRYTPEQAIGQGFSMWGEPSGVQTLAYLAADLAGRTRKMMPCRISIHTSLGISTTRWSDRNWPR